MHTIESNVFRFQNKPLLTFKDPKRFEYLRLEISSTWFEEEKKNK